MIEVEDLAFAYGGHEPIFEGFGFQVQRGEAWSVIGPSGCGKTTLLYLLAGLLRPGSGAIRIGGTHLSRPRPQTGLVLQDHGLLPWGTVEKNARLGLTIREFYGPDGKHTPPGEAIDQATATKRIDFWLKRLGIDTLHDKYPSQLSRGQRQRTAIARTFVLQPDLLLMDEPFSALDAAIRNDLRNLVIEFHQESDLTSVFVTHDIEEALFVGRKILVLNGVSNRESRVIMNEFAGPLGDRKSAGSRDLYEELRALVGRAA
jgi:NitT/TauT family transport system ATP-binding protein